jgi:hypothetical protein
VSTAHIFGETSRDIEHYSHVLPTLKSGGRGENSRPPYPPRREMKILFKAYGS